MAEIITCPSCQRKLQVPDDLLGQDVQCPTCGSTFTATTGPPTVPRAPGPPPLPPETRSSHPGRRPAEDYPEDYGEYGRPRRQRRDYMPHRGSTVLVLGILSLVIGCTGPILGPIAWIMGNTDLAEIRAGRMDPE